MRNFVNHFISKRFHLVVEEEDVTKALQIINKHHLTAPNMSVGNCGWADDRNKWFIHFTTSQAKWDIIRKEMRVKRVFENLDIPKNTIGVIYSTD